MSEKTSDEYTKDGSEHFINLYSIITKMRQIYIY